MKTIHLAVNTLSARRGGAYVFLMNILPAMLQFGNIRITLFCDNINSQFEEFFGKESIQIVHLQALGGGRRLLAEHIQIPLFCKKRNVDCLFQPDDTLSPIAVFLKIKTVVLFHASIQFYSGHELGDGFLRVLYWSVLKQFALQHSRAAVTVSFCTKAELARGSRKMLQKIKVVYHGVNHSVFFPDSKTGKRPLPYKYILSVSNRNPHKNIPRLIEAFAMLRANSSSSEHLVIIGTSVVKSEEVNIQKVINGNDVAGIVHFIDAIPNQKLAEYYRNASAYVYASVFDSFGFTPMEAMACGVPCAVSFYSALPETCGDAVLYFNPFDTEKISTTIKTILTDDAVRTTLIAKGLIHAKRYNWNVAANEYRSIVQELCDA